MKVIVAKDYKSQCAAGADIIEEIVRNKPDCCLGLATGSSPVGMYQELARRCREEGLDFSKVSTVNLDEYAVEVGAWAEMDVEGRGQRRDMVGREIGSACENNVVFACHLQKFGEGLKIAADYNHGYIGGE